MADTRCILGRAQKYSISLSGLANLGYDSGLFPYASRLFAFRCLPHSRSSFLNPASSTVPIFRKANSAGRIKIVGSSILPQHSLQVIRGGLTPHYFSGYLLRLVQPPETGINHSPALQRALNRPSAHLRQMRLSSRSSSFDVRPSHLTSHFSCSQSPYPAR